MVSIEFDLMGEKKIKLKSREEAQKLLKNEVLLSDEKLVEELERMLKNRIPVSIAMENDSVNEFLSLHEDTTFHL